MGNNSETTQWTLNGRPIRNLQPGEIDCRVGQVGKDNAWFTILLYKDARVDMKILNELVGPENWQRDHKEIKGNLYCGVGVFCTDEWVWKWDCGVESNTEKEKGEASDSFKRACVNWGIGYELYSSPRILLNPEPQDFNKSGKLFPDISVAAIEYNGSREVSYLRLVDKTGKTRYTWGRSLNECSTQRPEPASAAPERKPVTIRKGSMITDDMLENGDCKSIIAKLRAAKGTPEYKERETFIRDYYKWETFETFTALVRMANAQ